MQLKEASRCFCIPNEILQLYAQNGLLKAATAQGEPDYPEEEIKRAGYFWSLQKAGMDLDTLKRFAALLDSTADTCAQQIKILQKCRYALLEEIHAKQQSLDQLDYLIYTLKNPNTKGGAIP